LVIQTKDSIIKLNFGDIRLVWPIVFYLKSL
jgi:hypothetical protein